MWFARCANRRVCHLESKLRISQLPVVEVRVTPPSEDDGRRIASSRPWELSAHRLGLEPLLSKSPHLDPLSKDPMRGFHDFLSVLGPTKPYGGSATRQCHTEQRANLLDDDDERPVPPILNVFLGLYARGCCGAVQPALGGP
jgi:hypothetical protein